jgi:hypothetical protein
MIVRPVRGRLRRPAHDYSRLVARRSKVSQSCAFQASSKATAETSASEGTIPGARVSAFDQGV